MQAFPDFNLPSVSSWIEFWFVMVVPKYLNCSTLSKIVFPPHREYIAHYKHQRTNTVIVERPFRVKDAHVCVYLSSSELRDIPVRLPDKRHNQWRHTQPTSFHVETSTKHERVRSFVLGPTNGRRTAQSCVVSSGLQQTAGRKIFPAAHSWTAPRPSLPVSRTTALFLQVHGRLWTKQLAVKILYRLNRPWFCLSHFTNTGRFDTAGKYSFRVM